MKLVSYLTKLPKAIDGVYIMKYVENWKEVLWTTVSNKRKDAVTIKLKTGMEIPLKNKDARNLGLIIAIAKLSQHLSDNKTRDIFVLYNKIPIPKTHIRLLPYYYALMKAGSTIEVVEDRQQLLIKDNKNRIQMLTPNLTTGIYQIFNTFVREEYEKFNFANKVVLDIGGFIGDTAIYFALKGASKVYVYEPIPELYYTLLQNIKLNKFENTIIPKNLGVGSKSMTTKIEIPEEWGSSTIFSELLNNAGISKKSLREIQIQAISEVIQEVGSIDIIKIDCEGCEYEILESIIEEELTDNIREGIILEAHYLDRHHNPKYAVELLKKMKFKQVKVHDTSPLNALIWAEKIETRGTI